MDGETFTICSNQVDTIAYGGVDKKAYIQKVSMKEEHTQEDLIRDEAMLAMTFDTPVTKLEFCNGGAHLLGISEDSFVQIMDVETQKVTSLM